MQYLAMESRESSRTSTVLQPNSNAHLRADDASRDGHRRTWSTSRQVVLRAHSTNAHASSRVSRSPGENVTEAEAGMLDAYDKMGIPAMLTDKDGVVEGCNQTAADMQKRTPEEVLGLKLPEEVVSKPDRRAAKTAITDAAEDGNSSPDVALVIVASDASEAPVSADVSPRKEGNGGAGIGHCTRRARCEKCGAGMREDV